MSPVAPQHLLDPVPADDAAGQLGEHPADRPDREGKHGEQERNGDDGSWVESPGGDPNGPDHQHGEGAEAGQRLQQRVEGTAQPADRDHRVAQVLGHGREPGGLVGLAAHRLDHQRAVEALVRDRADLGPQLLGAGRRGDIRRE